MAGRKLPKEADAAFDKYTQNFVRRLHKPKAVEMFETEYKLTADEANTVFEIFDKDYNGELSYWEYKQFYLTVGENIKEIFSKFKEVEKDGTGLVDFEKLWESVRTMKTAAGRPIEESELETLIKASTGPEKQMDLVKFINLVCRIKQFRG